jgi:hypothetical protein
MDERDLYDEPDDTTQTAERDWERAVVPVEPDEAGELEKVDEEGEEGEPEADHLQDHSQLVEVEDDDEASLALRDMQVAANEEMAAAGLPDFDVGEYMAALVEAGAEGLALAEADMPMFTSFFDSMIEAGVGAAAIGAGIGWYLKMNGGASQQRYEADAADRDRMVGELQSEWGPKYEQNIFALKHLIGGMPNGVGDALQAARMPDGTLLINVPGFAETFLQVAKSGARTAPSPAARLAEISDILASNPQRYFKEGLDKEAVKLRNRLEGARDAAEARGEQQPATRRERELVDLLRTDPARYFKSGGSDELLAIRRARASRGQ